MATCRAEPLATDSSVLASLIWTLLPSYLIFLIFLFFFILITSASLISTLTLQQLYPVSLYCSVIQTSVVQCKATRLMHRVVYVPVWIYSLLVAFADTHCSHPGKDGEVEFTCIAGYIPYTIVLPARRRFVQCTWFRQSWYQPGSAWNHFRSMCATPLALSQSATDQQPSYRAVGGSTWRRQY